VQPQRSLSYPIGDPDECEVDHISQKFYRIMDQQRGVLVAVTGMLRDGRGNVQAYRYFLWRWRRTSG